MSLAQIKNEHQRLVILRLLSDEPGYDLNDSTLQDALCALGLSVSRDAVHVQLAWLEEQSLVTTKKCFNTVISTITSRGLDVANGTARIPGIKRPRPGE